MREVLSRLLTSRSPIRARLYPSRSNTIKAALLVLVAAPLTPFLFLMLVVYKLRKGILRLLVVDIDNEFGHFVEVMERTRLKYSSDPPADAIIVLSKYRFSGLSSLYTLALKRRIYFAGGIRLVWIQAFFLLSERLVTVSREVHEPHDWMLRQRSPIDVPKELVDLREECLRKSGCLNPRYVAMAVYSMQYEYERTPAHALKSTALETHGAGLAAGVDFLQADGVDLVMLGSPDVGHSYIPRRFPRLSEFGELGGSHEVALASGCHYFWTDNAGAWWLTSPFLKLVLCTNDLRPTSNARFISHFARYKTHEGEFIGLHRLLHGQVIEGITWTKAAANGEVLVVRNAPEELIAVHKEMFERVNGTYVEDSQTQRLRVRFETICEEYGLTMIPTVSGTFLRFYGEDYLGGKS